MRAAAKLLLVVGLVLAVSGTAGAITLNRAYSGPIAFDLTNRETSNTYYPLLEGTYGPGGLPLPSNVGVDYYPGLNMMTPGETGWGVVRINTIMSGAVAVTHEQIIENDADVLWSNGSDGKELVGIFWNLQDIGFVQGTDGTQTIDATGLKLVIFEQPVGTFASFGGFAQGTAGRLAADQYLGIGYSALNTMIAGATVFATGETTPGFVGNAWTDIAGDGFDDNVDTEFAGSYNPNVGIGAIAGNAAFNWELTGGTLDGLPAVYGEPDGGIPGANLGSTLGGPDNTGWFWGSGGLTFSDFDAEFVTRTNNPTNAVGGGSPTIGDWTITSSDVNTVYTVPEPITMIGAVMGIVGVAGYIRKRRTA